MKAEIAMEMVEGKTWYRIGRAYFPFLTSALLAAMSVGMTPVLRGYGHV